MLRVPGVRGDRPGPTPEAFARRAGLTLPVAVDDAAGTLAAGLGVRAFPTLLLVGADGRIERVLEGAVDAAQLREAVAALAT